MNPDLVYLAQTETTAGFLSHDAQALCAIKHRPLDKSFLISVDSLATLKELTRVPKYHKKYIRNAQKTTFVYSSTQAIRVVKDTIHQSFLHKLKWAYSTSSNLSGAPFDEAFAISKADVIVYTPQGFFESTPSRIFKLGKMKFKKLR